MHLKMVRWVWLLAVLCWSTAACSESDGASSGKPQDSDLPDEVEVVVGKKGAVVRVKGVALGIPAGALDKEVAISIKNVGKQIAGTKATALTDVYEFGPKGTTFQKDVEVSFAVEKEEPQARVFFTKQREPEVFEKLASTQKPGVVAAKVRHFSRGFAGIPEDEDLDDAGTEPGADASTGPDAGESAEPDASEPAEPDAGDGVPGAPRITLLSRSETGIAANQTWVAYRDGDSGWTTLSPTQTGRYEFSVTSAHYTLAAVCADAASGASSTKLVYANASSTEQVIEASLCFSEPAVFQLSGLINGVSTSASYYYGHLGTPGGHDLSSGAYTISGIPGGRLVDIALVVLDPVNSVQGGTIMRNRSFAADVVENQDLNGASWHVLDTRSFSVTGAEVATGEVLGAQFLVGGAKSGAYIAGIQSNAGMTNTVTFARFPEAALGPNDRYRFFSLLPEVQDTRYIEVITSLGENLTMSRPARFVATFSANRDGASFRPRMQWTSVLSASDYTLGYSHIEEDVQHDVEARIEVGYLDDPAPFDFTFPELVGLPGFDSNWVAPAERSVTVSGSAIVRGSVPGGSYSTRSEAQYLLGLN